MSSCGNSKLNSGDGDRSFVGAANLPIEFVANLPVELVANLLVELAPNLPLVGVGVGLVWSGFDVAAWDERREDEGLRSGSS